MGDAKVTANTVKREDGEHCEATNLVTNHCREFGLAPKLVLTTAVPDDGARDMSKTTYMGSGATETYL